MRPSMSCRINILPKAVLLVSLFNLHSLSAPTGLRGSEAVAAPPPPPPPPPPDTEAMDPSEWVNTDEVKITCLFVPQYVKEGGGAELECQWSPSKKIYSLKWYFNDAEFFSYKPEADPPVVTLPADGFKVDHDNSTGEKITLLEVGMAASGSYKCEVTMEGPGFVTADKSAEMKVVEIPEEKPRITGEEHLYRIGDVVDLTCSSAPSTPVADLTWYINNEQAPQRYLVLMETTRHPGGLQEAHKGLRFTVSPQHFRSGEMTLKCTANIPPLYTKTQQHSVDGMLTYETPVLSSREKSAVTGRARGGGRQLVEILLVLGALVVVEVVTAVLLSPTTPTTPTTTTTTYTPIATTR